MIEHIPTGCQGLDELLGNGVRTRTITQIYGPAGSGKSNIAMQTLINCCKMGKKAVFIDTEGSFSEKRLEQIAGPAKQQILDRTMLLEPHNFSEQYKLIAALHDKLDDSFGAIIVDSIVYHYRLEMDHEKSSETNKALGMQLAHLLKLAREKNVAVLVTNQVYSNPDTSRVEPVGGDVMRYGTKIIIALERNGCRKARLVKHQFLQDGAEREFTIVGAGVR